MFGVRSGSAPTYWTFLGAAQICRNTTFRPKPLPLSVAIRTPAILGDWLIMGYSMEFCFHRAPVLTRSPTQMLTLRMWRVLRLAEQTAPRLLFLVLHFC